MDICLLSFEEAGRLEHYGVWPACKSHRHIGKEEAAYGAANGAYRFLGGSGTLIAGPVSMVVSVRSTMWKPVVTSMPDGTKLLGMRTWGLKPQKT